MGIINFQETEFCLLEDELRYKLERITSGESNYVSRHLRLPFLRKHAVNIHSRPNILRSNDFIITEDRLAHQISFFGNDLPESFYRSVNHMVIIPELICSPDYFLTHIYIPSGKILAFYMYPSRLQLDTETFQENRILGRNLSIPGLLRTTALSISRLQKFQDKSHGYSSDLIHKFLHPVSELKKEEIQFMQEFSDMSEYLNLPDGKSV